MTIASLMIDIDGTSLTDEDKMLLASPYVCGVILFKRNITDPAQVRQLTDAMRAINPRLVIGVDQEGGRVARLKDGFTKLPAMGELGKLYQNSPQDAVLLAKDVGYLMACEVLAVGIDLSFAPVLDIDNGSLVIGDRAFCGSPKTASILADAFIDGMNSAGMKATGKHFPGHGSVVPDSHTSDVVDERTFDEIFENDTQVFVKNLHKLSALMPAHIVFGRIDDKPAGFSKIWLQDIVRKRLGFDGVLFSDDLSMKAAHIAGDVDKRAFEALNAGCDVALICNDRQGAKLAIACADKLPKLSKNRLMTMKAVYPAWQGDLTATCQIFAHYQKAKDSVTAFLVQNADKV